MRNQTSALVLSVTQLNTYVRSLLDGDPHLAQVFLSGEISNFTDHYRSGHLYFSLKDDRCVIRAVMFAQYAGRLRFAPEDGMKVIVRGRVGLYEVSGQYQIYVEDMQPDGLGALNLAYEQLKRKLEREGLFRPERKKPLPKFPESIGVITSPTGAAVHDILTILERRYPVAKVVFCPVQVQGEGAAQQIAQAVERFNRRNGADVLIVGRGGGSIEDLWAFNEEVVARAVAASRIPVISAVGHETDFTICDFAADLRAATPSAAAELAVPDRMELLGAILAARERMKSAVQSRLSQESSQLETFLQKRVMQRPQEFLELRKIRLDRLADRMRSLAATKLGWEKSRFSELCGKLETLSPLAVLGRGYSIVSDVQGRTVSSAGEIDPGDSIRVRMKDGTLACTVEQRIKQNGNDSKEGPHESEKDV